MRLVVFFSHNVSLATWASAGMLKREVKLYQRLAEEAVEVVFVTYGDETDYQWRNEVHGISIFPLFASRRKPKGKILLWLYTLLLPYIIRSIVPTPDLIKTNQILGGLIAVQMKRLWQRPLLVRCGFDPYQFALNASKSWSKALLIRWYSRLVYGSADRIHVASARDAAFVRGQYFSKKVKRNVSVRPNWVDTDLFFTSSENIRHREFKRILAIGRAVDQKNLELLIGAVALGCYGLDLITDESERACLKALAKAKGADVQILARVPHQELPHVYCRYPVYVMTSRYEGHPKTLLEAMACGCAVVGTEVPGISDVIDNGVTGLLVEQTPAAVHRAIVLLMGDERLRQRLGEAAAARIQNDYSLEHAVSKELVTYREMTRKASSGVGNQFPAE